MKNMRILLIQVKCIPKINGKISPDRTSWNHDCGIFSCIYVNNCFTVKLGTSYIINDFYRRFLRRNASEKHYVLVSRVSIVLMMIASLFITKYLLTTISGAWEFIINASAGNGRRFNFKMVLVEN